MLTTEIQNAIINSTPNKSRQSSLRSFFRYYKDQLPSVRTRDDILRMVTEYPRSNSTKMNIVSTIGLFLDEISFKDKYDEFYRSNKERFMKNQPLTEKEENALKVTYEDLIQQAPLELYREALLYNLLVHVPETPRLDYANLRYDPEDKTGNYIAKKNGMYYIVLNKYKTANKYGRWKYPIRPQWLNNWLDDYFRVRNYPRGEYLFVRSSTKPNEPMTRPTFSRFVENVFKMTVGTPITINALRKIKERFMLHLNPNINQLSMAQREDIAIGLFRHSYNSSLQHYMKV